jgi:tetratricopeptide (TPR) repeat protein
MRNLISLGVRCDVAFQLRCHSGQNVSHLFDWLVTPVDALITAFDKDFDIFRPENLELQESKSHRFVRDTATGIIFHHQFPTIGPNVTADFLLFYPTFIRKFQYLAERFRDYVLTRRVALVRRDISREKAEALEEAFFLRFPKADAYFLYVNSNRDLFETKHGASIQMARPGTGFGSLCAWANVLVQKDLVQQPFRLSSEDIVGRDNDNHGLIAPIRFSEADLCAAVAEHSEHWSWRLELARFYENKGDWGKALEVLRTQSLNMTSQTVDVKIEVAFIKIKMGETQVCLETSWFDEALTASLAAKQRLIDLMILSKEFEPAIRLCDQILEGRPVVHEIYFRKATCLVSIGHYRTALTSIELAIRYCSIRPNYFRLK